MSEWKMVPAEPTPEMLEAGLNAPSVGHRETASPSVSSIYSAMLSAAPQPTEQEVCDLERQLSDALEREKALQSDIARHVAIATAEAQISENLLRALKAIEDHHNFTEEWREIARTAIAQAESGDEPTYTDCPIHGRHEGDCPRC